MNKGILVSIGIFLAALVAAIYFMSFSSKESITSPRSTPISKPEETVKPTGVVKEFTVVGDEYSFSLDKISAAKGDTVKITFTNKGNFAHNYRIDELGLATKNVSKGESDTLEFIADTVGTFTFYCSVDSHENLGMKGELEVK